MIRKLKCHQLLEFSLRIICDFDARIEKPSYEAAIMDVNENVIDRISIPGKSPATLHGVNLPFNQKLTVEIGDKRTHVVLRGKIKFEYCSSRFCFSLPFLFVNIVYD